MSLFFFSPRRLSAVVWCLAAVSLGTVAQELPAHPPPLSVALDAAWRLSAGSRSLSNRQAELDARQQAAGAWLSAPPSLSLSQRSDRLNANQGLRESEASVALPLWSPGTRAATRAQVDADRAALAAEPRASQLKLAGELRELAASVALARLEHQLAQRKAQEASTLLQDTQRRVTSGDSPRVDALQAESAVRVAEGQAVQTATALAQAVSQWRALTGLPGVSLPDEPVGSSAPPALADHPLLAAANARARAAQARLKLAEADQRDVPELSVGVIRDRSLASDPSLTSLRVAVRIPFGGTHRNAPRLAAARAELDTAQAELDAAERQIALDQTTARDAVQAAKTAERLATERATLSLEAQALVAKAYRLGESDLPIRLRTDNERFDAELALARARVESQRAAARRLQSSGLLP